jgi:hypothetical protein
LYFKSCRPQMEFYMVRHRAASKTDISIPANPPVLCGYFNPHSYFSGFFITVPISPICLKFAVIFLLFYTAAWSRQRPISCCSWHGRNDFRLLINRTWKPSSLGNESSFCTLCSVNFSDVGTFWGEMCDIKELFSK